MDLIPLTGKLSLYMGKALFIEINMQTKICSKCKLKKSTKEFDIDKQNKDGISNRCKLCRSKHNINWYHRNIKRVKLQTKEWARNNPNKVKKYKLNWVKCNTIKRKKSVLKYHKKIRSTPEGKINDKISAGIYQTLKSNKAGRHWETLVGWTLNDLKKDFESKYYNGMSWKSFAKGGVDIHHIKEKHTFKFKTAEDPEFKECWALENLIPMWTKDHIAYHKKYPFRGNK